MEISLIVKGLHSLDLVIDQPKSETFNTIWFVTLCTWSLHFHHFAHNYIKDSQESIQGVGSNFKEEYTYMENMDFHNWETFKMFMMMHTKV